VNACIQHIIWLFANRTTVRKLIALLQQCGICDHPYGSAEDKKKDDLAVKIPHSLQQFRWDSLEQDTKIFRNKNISKKIKIKTKEHNNRQNFKICIRNLDTKEVRSK